MIKSLILKKTQREGTFYTIAENLSILPQKFLFWLKKGPISRNSIISKFNKNNGFIAVQFGSGNKRDKKYINSDILTGDIFVDITKSLPFKKNSIKYIYHSHLIEHIYNRQAKKFLKECFKSMKKGGVMRIVTPDLKKLSLTIYNKEPIKEYNELKEHHMSKSREKEFFESNYLNEFSHIFFGHKFLYDAKYLMYLCKKAGFSKVYEVKINESEFDFFKKAENKYEYYQKIQSMVIECVK